MRQKMCICLLWIFKMDLTQVLQHPPSIDKKLATQLVCVVMQWIHSTGNYPPNIEINCERLIKWYQNNENIRDKIISDDNLLYGTMAFQNFAIKSCHVDPSTALKTL